MDKVSGSYLEIFFSSKNPKGNWKFSSKNPKNHKDFLEKNRFFDIKSTIFIQKCSSIASFVENFSTIFTVCKVCNNFTWFKSYGQWRA